MSGDCSVPDTAMIFKMLCSAEHPLPLETTKPLVIKHTNGFVVVGLSGARCQSATISRFSTMPWSVRMRRV
jgi:hypothetical protein